jgi:predicted Zn-dependent protease
LLIEGGRAGDAREVLEKAVARAPWRASGRVALARARLATGDRETAIRELEAVVSERPDDPGALDAARRMLRAARGR